MLYMLWFFQMYKPLPPLQYITLTELCVSEPYFECEHGTFIQEEGAPMGGPLSDLLADLIIENKIGKRIW